jgi:hypothetical protein
MRRVMPVVVCVVLAGGCSPTANYEERMSYLRKIAQQGAETHQLLQAQEAPKIDADRCSQAWEGIQRPEEFPRDTNEGATTANWRDQIKQFFVDSCVSGKPKPVPGETTPPSSPPSAPVTSGPPATVP